MRLDRCSGCGRAYKREGRAVFDPDKGGIYCLKCRNETPNNPCLGAAAGSLLYSLQRGDIKAGFEMDGGLESCREIRRVMDLHIARRLGRVMKTAAFLD